MHFMASFKISSTSLSIFIIILFSNALSLASEPVITASPAVLPYVTAPNMSSFFPSPTEEWPLSSADPPEGLAPVPSSGEFLGKNSSNSVKLNGYVAVFCFGISVIFVVRIVYFV
ncbi:uncharacterized protein LOC105630199 [Jatropha curcas]|uniref:uncharacterized protein LOC105630199 n=1 Tax=Jatropha curcas TaxID=180498 RepID=UPI0005FB2EB9|nr:uncharacterized protein LOC105630199 [Jatropha curcas]